MTINIGHSIGERVDYLLSQMTLEEKLAQLGSVWATDLIDSKRRFEETKARQKITAGIGHVSRVGAVTLLKPQESATVANAIQRFLVEQTRLGIPAIVHEESCAGYMAREATTFPQAIGLAATWAPELVEEMAGVIRTQMRAVGAHHGLAPVLDVCRDPRWGRVEETFGEDPYLISRIGVAYVRGLQNHDLSEGVVATGKHFLGYGVSEGGLNWAPAHISPREMREIYAVPFWAAIQEAGLASMMNAYHELDGIPCGASKELMVDFLRDEMGFDGVVVSDYFTLDMLKVYHRVAADKEDAARQALEAGIDVELPATDCYGDPLQQALDKGCIDMNLIDVSVKRVLRQKLQLGLFENPYVDTGKIPTVFNTPPQRDLSLELARKSLVLLKNADQLLPLAPDLTSIAVIGPGADSIRLLQGDYHYPSHIEGVVISEINTEAPTPMRDLADVDFLQHFVPSVSVLAGIQAMVSSQTQIHYAPGCEVMSQDTTGFAEAVAAAQKSQVAVVVVAEKSGLSKASTTGESLDRADLGLYGVQQQLVEAIYATGTPVVVVLLNGRPLSIPWIAEHVPAIIEAWLPAQEGGTAIAEVLFGKTNPSGRLPMSIPHSAGQIPVFYNHKASGGRTHWQGDYIDMTTRPLFAFGYGLSYTQFEYHHLQITPSSVEAHDTVNIQVEIQNVGDYSGDEVVQLYLCDPISSVTRPVQELKGFKRLTLAPGERKTITFHLDVRHMAFFDRQMQFVVEPGEIRVMVGSASSDIRLTGSFTIGGKTTPVQPVFNTGVS
ncbi:MAG: glycoside hydrolase family 3 C-terminal domain-containing protein [Chloroflexi bacterium]|nr:glycoside hydrolase family 3 C-terminal domain-containing protein [Chloroflexota bacterium]